MITSTENNEKLLLALTIVEKLKKEHNIHRFASFKNTDYVVKSLLLEFKIKFVFTSNEYKQNLKLYNKGNVKWQDLRSISQKIFLDKLKECNNNEIDRFFGIKRIASPRK